MSKDDNLVSMSGAPIFRYTDGEKEWESPQGEESIEEISNHIEKHIGTVDMIYHEIVSDTVHIDIHHVKPTEERPFHTLITSGMSDLAMKVPEGSSSTKYMELMITLPEYWKISEESFKDENWYWPVRNLKLLARFPHKLNTFLGWGHSIPNGDPAEPYADNTNFTGVILLPSIIVPKEFLFLKLEEGKTIEFYSMVPLYEEEMTLKLNKGSDDLLAKFSKHKVSDIINPKRKNVAKKKFGLF